MSDGGCEGFRRLGATRREALQAGAPGAHGPGLARAFRCSRRHRGPLGGTVRLRLPRLRPGAVVHPDLPVGRAEPARHLGPQARRARGDPRRVRHDRHGTPGVRISEHFPWLAAADAPAGDRPLDDPRRPGPPLDGAPGPDRPPRPDANSDAAGPSPNDWPHLGALVARCRPTRGALPSAVTMPWTVAHPAAPGGRAPGQNGGWLGKAFDPFRVEGDPNAPGFQVAGLGLPEGVSPDRFARPPGLARRRRTRAGDPGPVAAARGTASRPGRSTPSPRPRPEAPSSSTAKTRAIRDRYGRHIHGQCLLLARRLVEAGVGLVTVNWHDDGRNFWDTHGDNFNRLKNRPDAPGRPGASPPCSTTWTPAACSTRPWSSGSASSAGTPRITARQRRPRALAALLLGRPGRRRGRAAGRSTARATAGPPTPPATRSAPTTSAPRSSTPSASTPSTEVRDPVGRPLRINSGSPSRRCSLDLPLSIPTPLFRTNPFPLVTARSRRRHTTRVNLSPFARSTSPCAHFMGRPSDEGPMQASRGDRRSHRGGFGSRGSLRRRGRR